MIERAKRSNRYLLKVRDTEPFRELRRSYTRKYTQNPEFRAMVRASVKRWQREHVMETRAYHAVKYAVRVGNLIRPAACQKCGDIPAPRIDGRSRIQAHHWHGYKNPLDVQWLCSYCHNKEHRRES